MKIVDATGQDETIQIYAKGPLGPAVDMGEGRYEQVFALPPRQRITLLQRLDAQRAALAREYAAIEGNSPWNTDIMRNGNPFLKAAFIISQIPNPMTYIHPLARLALTHFYIKPHKFTVDYTTAAIREANRADT